MVRTILLAIVLVLLLGAPAVIAGVPFTAQVIVVIVLVALFLTFPARPDGGAREGAALDQRKAVRSAMPGGRAVVKPSA